MTFGSFSIFIPPSERLSSGNILFRLQNKKDALSRELLEDIKMEMDSDDDDPFNQSLTDRLGSLKTESADVKPKVKQEKKPRKPREPKAPGNKKSPRKVSFLFS